MHKLKLCLKDQIVVRVLSKRRVDYRCSLLLLLPLLLLLYFVAIDVDVEVELACEVLGCRSCSFTFGNFFVFNSDVCHP